MWLTTSKCWLYFYRKSLHWSFLHITTPRASMNSKFNSCARHKFKVLTYLFTYFFTYLLTPWGRFLPEKLTRSQLVKKFPAFYGTRRFITTFTSARQLSLSSASSIQSTPPHPTSWRSVVPQYQFSSEVFRVNIS